MHKELMQKNSNEREQQGLVLKQQVKEKKEKQQK